MRDADRPIGRLRRGPSPFARRRANKARLPPADLEPADADAIRAHNSNPARGIVLGLTPALLLWTGLITLFVKLTR